MASYKAAMAARKLAPLHVVRSLGMLPTAVGVTKISARRWALKINLPEAPQAETGGDEIDGVPIVYSVTGAAQPL